MPTTSYVVTGMTCDHCVHAVTEEVSAAPWRALTMSPSTWSAAG